MIFFLINIILYFTDSIKSEIIIMATPLLKMATPSLKIHNENNINYKKRDQQEASLLSTLSEFKREIKRELQEFQGTMSESVSNIVRLLKDVKSEISEIRVEMDSLRETMDSQKLECHQDNFKDEEGKEFSCIPSKDYEEIGRKLNDTSYMMSLFNFANLDQFNTLRYKLK